MTSRIPMRRLVRYNVSLVQSIRRNQHLSQRATYKTAASHHQEKPRVNAVGIQYLSNQLQSKVFPNSKTGPEDPRLLKIAQKHLNDNDLLGKPTQISIPISIPNFPDLVGESGTLDEHFYKLGVKSFEPYLSMAKSFLSAKTKLPAKPKNWAFQSGWTRYEPGKKPKSVPYPLEDDIVFDVEVLYKISPYAVMTTAVTKKAWYGWVSPLLTEFDKDPTYNDFEHLVPFNCLHESKLMIGYNVGYDRARVFDEYNIEQSKAFYLDGMALHVATTGICSRQRAQWVKYKKDVEEERLRSEENIETDTDDVFDLAQQLQDNPWLNKAAPNSLKVVAKHHCNIDLDKTDRDFFSSTDPQIIVDNFQQLMDYCSVDVEATFEVTRKLFPEFLAKIPHPVSFAALRHLGSLILPSTKKWDGYIETAETIYQENKKIITDKLNQVVNGLMEDKDKYDSFLEDDWLSQLNWEIKEPRLKKNGEPAKRQAYLTGYPQWYRDLFKSDVSESSLTLRTRSTPFFLKLKWEGHPLFWTDSHGWCFKVEYDEYLIDKFEQKNYVRVRPREEREEDDDDADSEKILDLHNSGYVLFKVPHPNGPNSKCTNVLGKNYLPYFENGILSSEFEFAKEILGLNAQASYWMGNRQRIKDQFIVYNNGKEKNHFFNSKEESVKNPDMGIILPKICSMGTVTRRAVENTWLTASNSKKSRIGSELKAMIEVPKGYAFVGADVDSEELWIASLVGDSVFKFHGATALGWMTLEGTKNEGTDLHSKTANILGISRNDAKIFNYGRIYGAGVKYATRLLMQFNGKLSETQASEIATKLYVKTKGLVKRSGKRVPMKLYHGGSESYMFNRLEAIANEESPKTPVLGASITSALTKQNLNSQQFLPSRINWTIQSSGVDYLHLLIISMEYLGQKYNVPLRLAITVHDEVRYLCKEEHKYQVALLLQISNLWTRAMFCQQLGLNEVPQSCAFFSEVDIDKVLRKEVKMDCVTPSHPDAIPPGESLSIIELLERYKSEDFLTVNKEFQYDFSKIPYEGSSRVNENAKIGYPEEKKEGWLNLQAATTAAEWTQGVRIFEGKEQQAPILKKTKPKKKKIVEVEPVPTPIRKSTTKSKTKSEKSEEIFQELEISAPLLEEVSQFDEFDRGTFEDGDILLEQALKGYSFASTAKRRSDISDEIIPRANHSLNHSFNSQRRYLSKSHKNKKTPA